MLLPANHVIAVPYRPDGTCEAHIRPLNLEDIRSDRPGVPTPPPKAPAEGSAYTVHRAGPEAHAKYERRVEKQRLKKEQTRREHGLVV